MKKWEGRKEKKKLFLGGLLFLVLECVGRQCVPYLTDGNLLAAAPDHENPVTDVADRIFKEKTICIYDEIIDHVAISC
ncbi:hypothetical protein OUZ56_005836 [Daphnia magna]|uniref:Uncharacterized protein n=1 Tax=Daphnia magna TaxID=35525 RepID=A0ABQ9YTW8_9CRUS|nr:hypothetical protein OUZ56_005836 [Daphnia magna]